MHQALFKRMRMMEDCIFLPNMQLQHILGVCFCNKYADAAYFLPNQIIYEKEGHMLEERRTFLKATLGATALGVGTFVSAKCSLAEEKTSLRNGSGVVVGHSPKKEILYKKTANWDAYYKAAY